MATPTILAKTTMMLKSKFEQSRQWNKVFSQYNITSMHRLHHHLTTTKLIKNHNKPQTLSSLATDLSSWHGDTNRGIDFPCLRSPWFWLSSHCHPGNRANSSCCCSKHQVPPSIVALLIVTTDHLHLFPFSCSCSICDDKPPAGGYRRLVGKGSPTKQGGCHGDWGHFCNVTKVLNVICLYGVYFFFLWFKRGWIKHKECK